MGDVVETLRLRTIRMLDTFHASFGHVQNERLPNKHTSQPCKLCCVAGFGFPPPPRCCCVPRVRVAMCALGGRQHAVDRPIINRWDFFMRKNEVTQSNETKNALTCGACFHNTSFTDGVGPFTPGAKPTTMDSAKTEPQCKRGYNSTCATKPPSHFLAMEVVPLGTWPLPTRPRTDVSPGTICRPLP